MLAQERPRARDKRAPARRASRSSVRRRAMSYNRRCTACKPDSASWTSSSSTARDSRYRRPVRADEAHREQPAAGERRSLPGLPPGVPGRPDGGGASLQLEARSTPSPLDSGADPRLLGASRRRPMDDRRGAGGHHDLGRAPTGSSRRDGVRSGPRAGPSPHARPLRPAGLADRSR